MAGEIPLALRTNAPIPNGVKPVSLEAVLMQKAPEQLVHIPGSIQDVQQSLRLETGRTIPQDFLEKLGFANLEWELQYLPFSGSVVFLGRPETDDPKPASILDATGSIVYRRKPVGGDQQERTDTVLKSTGISVTGINTETANGPVVQAVRFSSYTGETLEFGFSLPQNDLPYPQFDSYQNDRDHEFFGDYAVHFALISSIPTNIYEAENETGLVTYGMSDVLERNGISDPILLKRKNLPYSGAGFSQNTDYFERRGVTAGATDTEYTVSFQAPKKPLLELSFPKAMVS